MLPEADDDAEPEIGVVVGADADPLLVPLTDEDKPEPLTDALETDEGKIVSEFVTEMLPMEKVLSGSEMLKGRDVGKYESEPLDGKVEGVVLLEPETEADVGTEVSVELKEPEAREDVGTVVPLPLTLVGAAEPEEEGSKMLDKMLLTGKILDSGGMIPDALVLSVGLLVGAAVSDGLGEDVSGADDAGEVDDGVGEELALSLALSVGVLEGDAAVEGLKMVERKLPMGSVSEGLALVAGSLVVGDVALEVSVGVLAGGDVDEGSNKLEKKLPMGSVLDGVALVPVGELVSEPVAVSVGVVEPVEPVELPDVDDALSVVETLEADANELAPLELALALDEADTELAEALELDKPLDDALEELTDDDEAEDEVDTLDEAEDEAVDEAVEETPDEVDRLVELGGSMEVIP